MGVKVRERKPGKGGVREGEFLARGISGLGTAEFWS